MAAEFRRDATKNGTSAAAFAAFLADVRAMVDAELTRVLDARVEAAARWASPLVAVTGALRSLTLRGGKRFRAALLAAAYEACGGQGGAKTVAMAGAALELLQTYLLIHDDWMDGDDVRRGGPSVHAFLRGEFGSEHVGDTSAILAGDHASALAQELVLEGPLPADRLLAAAREFARIQEDVVYGQLLDVHAAVDDGLAVERMHELKTGSYTVRGPLVMGALLAGADAAQCDGLCAFARPLGVAFQLRDDVLGTFGDPGQTGKPSGNDIRRGKRTALIAELEGDAEAEALLPRVFGRADADEDALAALVVRIEASGARARVEARLDALLAESVRLLADVPLLPEGRRLLEGAVHALGLRER
jgi:geranylgeranyl diphosphate synthase type I